MAFWQHSDATEQYADKRQWKLQLEPCDPSHPMPKAGSFRA
jgi:hypothetical protein